MCFNIIYIIYYVIAFSEKKESVLRGAFYVIFFTVFFLCMMFSVSEYNYNMQVFPMLYIV